MPTYLYMLMSSEGGTVLKFINKAFDFCFNEQKIHTCHGVMLDICYICIYKCIHTVFFAFWRLRCGWYQFVLRVTHVSSATTEIHFFRRRCINTFGIITGIISEATLHLNMRFTYNITSKQTLKSQCKRII